MPEDLTRALRPLRRQLMALGVAKGLLFWYAIEKLFETRIGFSAQQIVLIGIIAQGSKVIFELPTSVVADRWSRRSILLLAQAAMLICVIVLGFSHSLGVYIAGTLFWSLSDALTSGVYEAFAYDSISTSGHEHHFSKIYTRMKSCEYAALALSGVGAGILGVYFSLRLSFFLSALSVLACCALLLRLPEPSIRRTTDTALSWVGHIGGAFKALAGPGLRWPATLYITLLGFLSIWYEYYQLLGIDIHLTPVLFGMLITVLTLGMAVGSEIAHRRPNTPRVLLAVWGTLLATHLLGLRFHNAWMVFASLIVTFVALTLLEIYLEIYIQTTISSERRATIFSLATTLGYACFFGLAGLFVLVLKSFGVRGALTVASLPLLILGAVDVAKRLPWAGGQAAPEPLMEKLPER